MWGVFGGGAKRWVCGVVRWIRSRPRWLALCGEASHRRWVRFQRCVLRCCFAVLNYRGLLALHDLGRLVNFDGCKGFLDFDGQSADKTLWGAV